MPTRHELITKAASFPVGHPERKAILDSLSKKARGPLLLWTGQGMETREFGVAEQRLHGDAEDIARQILELPARRIGTVGGDQLKITTAVGAYAWPVSELHDLWWNAIARVMD